MYVCIIYMCVCVCVCVCISLACQRVRAHGNRPPQTRDDARAHALLLLVQLAASFLQWPTCATRLDPSLSAIYPSLSAIYPSLSRAFAPGSLNLTLNLAPSTSKQSKGVASVGARVTNLQVPPPLPPSRVPTPASAFPLFSSGKHAVWGREREEWAILGAHMHARVADC